MAPRLVNLALLLLVASCAVLSSGVAAVRARRIRGGRVQVEAVSSPVTHGEGPHWSAQDNCLYFVDIDGSAVHRLNASTGEVTKIAVPPGPTGDLPVSLVVPVENQDTLDDGAVQLVVSRGRELVVLDVTPEGTANVTRVLGNVEEDKSGNRFNDAKADPRGRLWAGTMGPEGPGGVEPAQGSLYVLSENSTLDPMVTEVDISNGLAWSADGSRMYYIDTGTNRVDTFDYDLSTGAVSNRRPAFDFTKNNVTGPPDGMAIDANGTLWVACYFGYQVVMIEPTSGTLMGSVALPAKQVTSVAWGGPQMDTLYVTTSRRGLTPGELEQTPLAGSLFKVTGLGVRGLPGQGVKLPAQS